MLKRICGKCGKPIKKADMESGSYIYSKWEKRHYHLMDRCQTKAPVKSVRELRGR